MPNGREGSQGLGRAGPCGNVCILMRWKTVLPKTIFCKTTTVTRAQLLSSMTKWELH
jgi:hypothetical protein